MTTVIGLTGGIGSGKSSVSQILAEMGAVIIDSDKVGHEVFNPGTAAWREVVASFGHEIVAPDGQIDRAKLGKIIFNDSEARQRLNAIMHPKIYEAVKAQIKQYRQQGIGVVVLEAAILLEVGWHHTLVDEVWVVMASEEAVVRRLAERNKLSREQVLARIHSQSSNEERLKEADVVINNDAGLEELRAEVKEQWDRLQSGKKPTKNIDNPM